jgi:hypothetical protein
MMRLDLSLPAFSLPVAPCPSKGSPRQQPHRVTAAVALPPADRAIPPPVLPRAMGWFQPAGHKALLHCRVRCHPRCCHRGRPVPSLGLRTFKTFRRFRECETSFWCSPVVVAGRMGIRAKRFRRSDCLDGPVLESPERLGRRPARGHHRVPKHPGPARTTSARRRIPGPWRFPHREQAAEAVPELSMTSRRFQRGPANVDRFREPGWVSRRGRTVLPWSGPTGARPSAEASGRLSPWGRRSAPGAEAPAGEEPDLGAEGTTRAE